jgi:hypothetical protein
MEPIEQQNTPPQLPPKRSVLVEALTGGTIGATIGLITSVFHKKMGRGKQAAIGAAIGAGIGVAANLFSSKEPAVAEMPVATPPTVPPITPTHAPDLQLAHIPQILDLLLTKGQLTPPQQAQVLQEIKTGKTGFAGEIAVADGFITPQQLQEALTDQASRKAEAALGDIQSITDMYTNQLGAIAAPAWLRANWGNNGVNPASKSPTRVDGATAAANAAQNLVMLAYATNSKDPALLATLREGVLAAANLTRGITQGSSALVPLEKMSTQWIASMNAALNAAAQTNPGAIMDANGKPVDIQNYIHERDEEITAAVKQTIAAGVDRSQNQGRA